jgi:hypothetical protein
MNDFLNTLNGKLIGAICGIIILFLVTKWESIKATLDNGVAIEKQGEFNTNLKQALKTDSIASIIMENEHFVELLFASPIVKQHTDDLGKELKKQIIEDVLRKDTNKVSSRSYVAIQLGIRDEAYLPLLTNVLGAFDRGELLTKEDADKYIEAEFKRLRRVAKF